MYPGWPMRRYNFTLAELIIVSVILSVLGFSVYAALSNGIRLWKRINQEVPQEDVNIFFVKMSDDLRSLIRHSDIVFSGKQDSISFATFIVSDAEESSKKDIGMVSYRLEKGERAVSREQSNYSQIYLSKPGRTRQLLSDVVSFKLRYYCYDSENEEYLWLDSWDADDAPPGVEVDKTLPISVRVEVGLRGYEEEDFSAIVAIPVGG